MWKATPDDLIDALSTEDLRRAYLVTPRGGGPVRASHPLLEPLAREVSRDTRDYHDHEGWFIEVGAESNHLLSACVHWTYRGQAAGGVRLWRYSTVEDFVRDGLRLSRGMGQKCALAGLWWGGGKGVIARRAGVDHTDRTVRDAVYRDYGRFISGLGGCYVTAEDAGTRPEDMVVVFSTTRFTTCIPPALGGSGNPSRLTATGVVVAMEAALESLRRGPLAGKSVATQGLGNVASFMIGDLLDRGVTRIVGADLDADRVRAVSAAFPGAPLELRAGERAGREVLSAPCDVLAPNAVGGTLNPTTIPTIRASIVCGAANNQLEDPARDAELLARREVLYVPDFLANRMGIVNCANEQYGHLGDDPSIMAHLDRHAPTGIYQRCIEVLERARRSGRTPAQEAERMADELARESHPIWPHRGRLIIDHLVESGWDRG